MNAQTQKTIAGVVGFGVSGLSWLAYAGPYKWMVDIQTATIGAYYPVLSFILPALGIGFVVERLLNHFCSSEETPEPGSVFSSLTNQPQSFYQLTGGAVGLIAVALWMLIPTMSANDEIEPITLIGVERGEAVETSWVSTSGRMLWDECGVEDDLSQTLMIPIVSNGWREGKPVAAFVKMSGYEARDFEEKDFGKFEGMLRIGGMPADWVEFFEDETDLKIADDHIMIDYGATPGFNRNCGLICLAGSWILGMISIFTFNSEVAVVTPQVEVSRPAFSIEHEPASPQIQPTGLELTETGAKDVTNAIASSVDDDVKNWMASRGING